MIDIVYLNYLFSSNLYNGNSYQDANMYPTGYDQSYNYALALAGYSFTVKQVVAFDVYVSQKNISHYTVTV